MLDAIRSASVSDIYAVLSTADFLGIKRKKISPKNPVKVMDWRNAFMRSRLTRKQKECLLAIHKYIDFGPASGRISMETLANELGISRRRAQDRVSAAKRQGWIRVARTIKKSNRQGCNLFIATLPIYPEADSRSVGAMVSETTPRPSVMLMDATDFNYASTFNKNRTITRRNVNMGKLAIPRSERQKPSTLSGQKPSTLYPVDNTPVEHHPPISPFGAEGSEVYGRPTDFSQDVEDAIEERAKSKGKIELVKNEKGFLVEAVVYEKPKATASVQKVLDEVRSASKARMQNDLKKPFHISVAASWKMGFMEAFPAEVYVAPKHGHIHGWIKSLKRAGMPHDKALEFTAWVSYSWSGLKQVSYKNMKLPATPSLGLACALFDSLHDKFANPQQFINKVTAKVSDNPFDRYKHNLMAHGVPEAEAEAIASRKYAAYDERTKAQYALANTQKKLAEAEQNMSDLMQRFGYIEKVAQQFESGKFSGNPHEVMEDMKELCRIIKSTKEQLATPTPNQPTKQCEAPSQSSLNNPRTIPNTTTNQIPLGADGKPLYEPHEWWYEGMSEEDIKADRENLMKMANAAKEIASTGYED